jgi:hypothetical protein
VLNVGDTHEAISVTAIEDEGHEDLNAAIICGTANKGLHGLPGISFILCSDKGIERLHEVPARSLYLNVATYLTSQRKGDIPCTPAVQVCFALDEAIGAGKVHRRDSRRSLTICPPLTSRNRLTGTGQDAWEVEQL